jgi:hypothetical protein
LPLSPLLSYEIPIVDYLLTGKGARLQPNPRLV